VHPVWTVTDTWYDNGETLRLASTAWITLGCIAIALALFSVRWLGIERQKRIYFRFTSRSLIMATTVLAVVLVLARTSITDVIPASRSLPAVWLAFMLLIALHSSEHKHRKQIPRQIEIPAQLDANREGGNNQNDKRLGTLRSPANQMIHGNGRRRLFSNQCRSRPPREFDCSAG